MRTFPASSIAIALALAVATLSGCGSDDPKPSAGAPSAEPSASLPVGPEGLDGVVKIDGDRGLYVRCTGTGSPTVVMEGGDEDTSDSYRFAEASLSSEARTCVYDRANLGQSSSAPGPRGLTELVDDLEALLIEAEIPGPYVLVGTSGGGFITAGYASRHPEETAGLVFIDTGAPFRNPPAEIVEATTWDNPVNIEARDYLQVEKDAWAGRREIGDIPVTVVTVKYSDEAIAESPFPSERSGMRRNVSAQKGWLVLSPQAKQVVVETGHAVEEDDPELVIDVIRDVVHAAQ